MGLLSRRLGVQAMSLEDPAQPLIPPSALFESLGLGRSDAGVLVNETAAMRVTTALACIKIVSEDLGTTAHEIFQEMPDRSMRLATEHRQWPILHDRPNPDMTAADFWGGFLANMLGWGNGYAWIKRDGAARVISLHLLKPGLTSPVKLSGKLMYGTTQTDSGQVAYIDPENILHIRYLTFDGIIGISPIQYCKNAFGLALAAEKFGAQFFGNGARSTGVLSHPGALEEEAYENLKKSVREWANGESALRPIILEEGMSWQQITINPNDAQFLQTRQFQDVNIARLYRVAMHLLQDLQRATNNNIEHQSLDHVRHCLRPNAVKIEQEVNYKLLGGSYTMEHNLNDLQRGDFQSQATAIQTLRNIGIYSTNDGLRKLRENPISEEEGGDVRTVQGAMIPLTALLPGASDTGDDQAVTEGEDDSQPFNSPHATRILASYRGLFRDAVGRVTNRKPGADEAFAYRALQPAISSMAQTLLAIRFGNVDLTKKELDLISSHATHLAASSSAWEKRDAATIATRITEGTFNVLAKEILS